MHIKLNRKVQRRHEDCRTLSHSSLCRLALLSGTERDTAYHLRDRAEVFLRPMIWISDQAQEDTQSSRVLALVGAQQRPGLFKREKALNGRIAFASHLYL